MRLRDRVTAAFSILRRGDELPQARESRGRFLLNIGPFKLQRRQRKVDQLQAYQNWVAAAVNQIARDIRQSRHMFGVSTGTGAQDFDPFEGEVPQIFSKPQRQQTFGHMLELTAKHLDLAGEAFWYLVTNRGDVGGEILAIQCINPNFITEPVYSEAERRFTQWRFNNGVADFNIPMEDMVWFRYPHPLEEWRGASPVESIALSYDMDLFAKAYGTQILEGGGSPPGVLSLEQEITPEQAAIIRQRWKQQRREDPEAIGVVGKGAQFEATGTSLKDLEFLNMSRMNRDQVLAIYGVPAAKLGLIEDVNRNNADSVNREYARNSLKPRLNLIAEGINEWIMPRIPELEGQEFRFEDPIQPDREFHLERAEKGFAAGVITVDEYRTETGRDPIEDETAGSLYKRSGSFRDSLEHEERMPPPGPGEQPGNQPPGNGQGGNDDDQDEDEQRTLMLTVVKSLSDALIESVKVVGKGEPVDKARDPVVLEGFFEEIDPAVHSTDDVIKAARARGLLPIDLPMSRRQLEDGASRFQIQQEGLERAMRAELRKLWAAEKKAVVERIRSLKNPPKVESRMIVGPPTDGDWFELHEFADQTESHIWRAYSTVSVDGLIDGSDIERDLLDVIFGRQERSWLNTFRKFFQDGFERGWDLLKRDTGRPLLEFERVRIQVEARAVTESAEKLAQIRQTSRRRVAKTIQAGIDAKLSVAQIANAVARMYDTFRGDRSLVVARTETAQYVNRGKRLHEDEATQVLGTRIRNTWTAILDERVRQAHEAAHTQVRFLGDPFNVGGEQLRHPHDPDGSASNVINCRCTLVSEFVDQEE